MNLSIVIPVFNDTLALSKLLQAIFITCKENDHDVQIILVDDGSEPTVWQTFTKLKAQYIYQDVKLIRLVSNQGQQRATLCGVMHATGDIIITMDADYQHPPAEIPKLVQALASGSHDLVYGTAQNGHALYLQLASKLLKWLLHQTGNRSQPGSRVDRHANAFRGFSAPVAKQIITSMLPNTINIDSLLLKVTQHPGIVQTSHRNRLAGQSTYTLVSRLKLATRTLSGNDRFTLVATILIVMITIAGIGISLCNSTRLLVSVPLLIIGIMSALLLLYQRLSSKYRYPALASCIAEIVE